jgi:NAD(P)-dependent dehydrogenase (short-subunit alcohol dehydrogenase family)
MAPAAPRDEEDEMGDRLAGKVALATGAAKGIGRAIVRRFAEEGATLWINDVDADGLEAVVRELRDAGTTVDGVAGDASDPELVGAWGDAATSSPTTSGCRAPGSSASSPTTTGGSSSA